MTDEEQLAQLDDLIAHEQIIRSIQLTMQLFECSMRDATEFYQEQRKGPASGGGAPAPG
ncbi:hypothetical protein AB0L53_43755 [Nonomuraea sp. NPDC052129]|uniref:hypothetical protein n=1 Tax=unclassified Nonomuraea TaxID=2593643 RepID=UPI0033E8D6D3